MEVKEAIHKIRYWLTFHTEGIDRNMMYEALEIMDTAIEQGEVLKAENVELKAYKQIVEELNILNREYFSNYETRTENIIRMKQLFEKYFPKEVNKSV